MSGIVKVFSKAFALANQLIVKVKPMYKDAIELYLPNAINSILSALYQLRVGRSDMVILFLSSASQSLNKSDYKPAQNMECKIHEATMSLQHNQLNKVKEILDRLVTDINGMQGELLQKTQHKLSSIGSH
jgi:type II secretory pathway component PulL